MKIATGVDIIEIDRIKNSINSLGDNFLNRIFTKEEIKYCETKKVCRFESYAVRFAAKEAVSKAMGTGIGKDVSFNEIVVVNDSSGMPKIELYGNAKRKAQELDISDVSLSLSHCKDYAVAFVVTVITR